MDLGTEKICCLQEVEEDYMHYDLRWTQFCELRNLWPLLKSTWGYSWHADCIQNNNINNKWQFEVGML